MKYLDDGVEPIASGGCNGDHLFFVMGSMLQALAGRALDRGGVNLT